VASILSARRPTETNTQADSRDEILNLLLTTPRALNQLRTARKRWSRRGKTQNFLQKNPRVSHESIFHRMTDGEYHPSGKKSAPS
jgi:adenylate kinase family enzyme